MLLLTENFPIVMSPLKIPSPFTTQLLMHLKYSSSGSYGSDFPNAVCYNNSNLTAVAQNRGQSQNVRGRGGGQYQSRGGHYCYLIVSMNKKVRGRLRIEI